MAEDRRNGEPTELVYLPVSSWQPILLAAGIGGVIASLFIWWPYGVVGAVVALLAALSWVRDSREDFFRLPRSQRVSTAVIPAVPFKRRPR